MSRIEEDSKFIGEDAKWLPLDSAVLSVRKCLHEMIAALMVATDYLCGRSNDAPKESMSRRFAVVHTHECRDFEELCDRVKDYAPGTIPESRIEDILRLARILATRTEAVLPTDDDSSHELRCAIQALFNLACNAPTNGSSVAFAADVESTRKQICDGFKSLSKGFSKLERKRERGEEDKSRNDKDEVIAHIDEATAEMHSEAAGIRHEVERLRKGGKATKRWGVEEQLGAAKVWKENKNNLFIKQQMDHDGRIQKPDVFAHCKKELAGFRVESPDEFIQILEQHRGRQKAAKARRRVK